MPNNSPNFQKFSGRRREIILLQNLLQRDTRNDLIGLVVSGDFGVGRSTLLGEFRSVARNQQCTVVDLQLNGVGGTWGRCRVAAPDGSSETKILAEPLADIVGVIAETSRLSPVLVTADDVYRADGDSLRTLHVALEKCVPLPVVVAVSVQRGLPPRAPSELAKLVHGMEQMALEGLSEQETADLARSILRQRIPSGYATSCHRLTAGNPFMLAELLCWASESDASTREELTLLKAPVLPRLREAVARRLDLLDPALLPVATMIAVASDSGPDTLPLIAKLSGTTLEETLIATDQLIRLGFIAGDGSLALRHPLLAKALAGGVTDMARNAIHLRSASYLHQRGAAIQRIAQHLVASSVRSDDAWPSEILLKAAYDAARNGDHDTALAFTEHAGRTTIGEQHLKAALLACDIHLSKGWEPGVDLTLASLRELQSEHARVQLLDKLDVILHTTAPDPTTRARLLATVRTTLAGSSLALWDRLHNIVHQLGSTTVERTMDQLGDHVTNEADTTAGEPVAAAHLRAVRAFRAFCLHLAGQDDGEAVRQARNVLDEYRQTPTTPVMGAPAALAVLAHNGFYEEAEARAQALGHGNALFRPDCAMLLVQATIALGQNRVDSARSSLEQLLDALPSATAQPVPLRLRAIGLLAELLAEQGDSERAWTLLKRHGCADELAPGWLYLDILLARAGLRAAAGDLDGSARDLKELLDRARTAGVHPTRMDSWRRHGVTRLWQCGMVAEAGDAAAEQLQMAQRADRPRELGRALRTQAQVSDGLHAERLLLKAIDLLRGDEAAVFDLALAQADRGALLLRLGEPERAIPALVEAVALARSGGRHPLAQQATALLAATDVHPSPEPPLRGLLTLTERERQIFLMATQGTSNSRIAKILKITRRTVELHLSSAYRKLDIAGRRDFPELLSVPGVRPMLEVGWVARVQPSALRPSPT
ncbi:helix-turn-helix transcriptional regulator [Streptomyces griseorubiginosus]|uniref:helix-turn-helix transcriptional regulator n=1 Tax=Streptomyces griseorubiginosus TaxID=67304 RepID=UPI0033E8948E